MSAPQFADELVELVRKSELVEEQFLSAYLARLHGAGVPFAEARTLAAHLVRDGILTTFQAEHLLQGKRRFRIGTYTILELLGAGSTAQVFLCEDRRSCRPVAVKVLSSACAADPWALARFQREALILAKLHHANFVHIHGVGKEESLPFLVMEYVDRPSLRAIMAKRGSLPVLRAAHYMRQAAVGLQHAHEHSIVHGEVKPSHILVDRTGCVKIIDMGWARITCIEQTDSGASGETAIVGNAGFVAPEQIRDPDMADSRADIYSLGARFYFCLTGDAPFHGSTVTQALLSQQTRLPEPIRQLRRAAQPCRADRAHDGEGPRPTTADRAGRRCTGRLHQRPDRRAAGRRDAAAKPGG